MQLQLSEKTIDLLSENGYRIVTNENIIKIHQSGSTRTLILLLGIFFCVASLVLTAVTPLFSFLWFLIILSITIYQYNQQKGKSTVIINLEKQFISYGNFQSQMNAIQSVELHSEYVDEYTSAFKETSEEYHITISIKLEPHYRINLLIIKSDYPEPSAEILETYNWVKALASKSN